MVLNTFFKILIRCKNELFIKRTFFDAADSFIGTVFNDAQELCLQQHGQLPYLIQQQRSVVGLLKQADSVLCAGVGSLDRPEQQTFQKPESLRVNLNGTLIEFKPAPVYTSLRQIAWEVLESLKGRILKYNNES